MNLLFRLFWLGLLGREQPDGSALGPCRTRFRVYPTDLDLLRHVNNGRFFSLMDLARIDMITRGGLTPHLRRLGWFPVVVAETIQLRRPLTLFDSFVIDTRVLGWDNKAFIVEQQFERGRDLIASALVRTRFLSRHGGAITPREILALVNLPVESPPLPPYASRWNADQVTWQGATRKPHQANAA